jgi:hypothetical protein
LLVGLVSLGLLDCERVFVLRSQRFLGLGMCVALLLKSHLKRVELFLQLIEFIVIGLVRLSDQIVSLFGVFFQHLLLRLSVRIRQLGL